MSRLNTLEIEEKSIIGLQLSGRELGLLDFRIEIIKTTFQDSVK